MEILLRITSSLRRGFPLVGLIWWIVVFLIVLMLLPASVRDLLGRRKSVRDFALADGAFGDQFPAEMTTVVNGARIATDRGVVWFLEGLTGFSGEASSFVLAASDLAPQWIRAKRHPTGKELPPNALALLGAARTAYLQIAPLMGHGKAYRKRFGEFMAANERPESERFWPPLERYEEASTGVVVRH